MRQLLHILFFTLTASTLVIAAPPPILQARGITQIFSTPFRPTKSLFNAADRVTRLVPDQSALASRFPGVPAEELQYIGHVPENLYPLVRGADRDGALTFARPEAGHALLLTRPLSDGRVRGVGMATTEAGHTYYFRTEPFEPNNYNFWPEKVVSDSRHHVPPRSYNEELFGSRKLNFDWGPEGVYRFKGKYPVSHISMLRYLDAANQPHLYPATVLQELRFGPVQGTRHIEWSVHNNWSLNSPLWSGSWLQRLTKRLRWLKIGVEWRAEYYAKDAQRRLKAVWQKLSARYKSSPKKPTDSPGATSHVPPAEEEEVFHTPSSSPRAGFNGAASSSIHPQNAISQEVKDLDWLLKEPSGTGQHFFNAPKPGEALLLTQVLSPTTARGIGQVNTLAGESYFFHTRPFKLASEVPSFATDYPARQVLIRQKNGQTQGVIEKLSVSHASLVPLNQEPGGLSIYTPDLLEQVLGRKKSDMVAWSPSQPEWTQQEMKEWDKGQRNPGKTADSTTEV